MKKIIDSTLLEMSERGDQQKEIALFFGVSEAAISKRLKRLRKQKETAAVMANLTEKQQVFVSEICSGKNQTESALSAFDCLPDSASAIATTLMRNEMVQTAIHVIMEENGLSRSHLINSLRRHVDGGDNQVSLRAVDMGLKLHGAYPAAITKNLNVNVGVRPVDLSRYQ